MSSSIAQERYIFLDVMGAGTYGDVYRARYISTGHTVAIKVVPKSTLHSPEACHLLQTEIEIYKSLDHPLIAQFFDAFEDDKFFYISQECAEGGSFLNYVNRTHGLQEDKVRFYFIQLLSVVDYLHNEKNVVHRDLKMENLLLDCHNNIRLIDFGLSAILGENETLNEPCGTPAYVAPEVILRKSYGKQIDIWGLGILLYAMANGKLPFYNEDVNALVRNIVFDEPKINGKVSPLLQDLLNRMLCKNPAMRITLEEIKQHPWVLEGNNFAGIRDDRLSVNGGFLDREVMQWMQEHGYEISSLPSDLENGLCNQTTVVYTMLKKQSITDELFIVQNPDLVSDLPVAQSQQQIPFQLSSNEAFMPKLLPLRSHQKRSNSFNSKKPIHLKRGLRRMNPTKTAETGIFSRINITPSQIQSKTLNPMLYGSIILESIPILEVDF